MTMMYARIGLQKRVDLSSEHGDAVVGVSCFLLPSKGRLLTAALISEQHIPPTIYQLPRNEKRIIINIPPFIITLYRRDKGRQSLGRITGLPIWMN
jgi:hypothetical protein